jgi:hypothetical protein
VAVHPIVAGAVVLLVANDHVLKARWPGAATGLASGVAGLVVLPAVAVVAISAARRRDLVPRTVDLVALVVALGYASVELLPLADRAYELGLGFVGWPVRALAGSGRALTVEATADPWDLLALPAAIVVPLLWRRAAATAPTAEATASPTAAPRRAARPAPTRRWGPALLVAVALPALLATSPEREPDTVVPAAARTVALTPDAPVAAFAITVDVTAMEEVTAVELLVGIQHEAGEPALRWIVEPSASDALATIEHLPATLRTEGRAEGDQDPIDLLEFGECEQACRVDARLTVELIDRTSGTWSGALSVAARFRSAEVEASVAIAPDPAPPRWGERVLGTGELELDPAGDGALVLRPASASEDPVADALAILAHDASGAGIAEVGAVARPDRQGTTLDRCADLADCASAIAVFPIPRRLSSEFDRLPEPGAVSTYTALRRGSGTELAVDVLPATRTSTALSPRSSAERIERRVSIAPGATLYAAVVPEDDRSPATLESTSSTGEERTLDPQPALLLVETCPADATSPCTAVVRVGSSGVGSVTLHTFEVRDYN